MSNSSHRPNRRVLAIYDDAPVFGGHEQMSCAGIEALAQEEDLELLLLSYEGNEKLNSKFEGIVKRFPRAQWVGLPIRSRKFQGVRSRFAKAAIREVADVLQSHEASALLCLQGDIELSSIGVLAGNRLGIPTVSYIPVPHTLATMQAKLGRFRDPLNRWLFHRPDAFITISEGMKTMLQERGAKQRIEVVLNGFDPTKTRELDKLASRKELDLDPDRRWVAMVGRVEFKQKRQDFLLECFAAHRERFPDVSLLFVGSGPDGVALQARAKELGLGEELVRFVAWTDGLSGVYSAIDLLALPSRFEGVPLVMLEAMSVGLPIVASARDGMKEFLPEAWLFEPDSMSGFADRLVSTLKDPGREALEANRQRASREFSLSAFRSSFIRATRELSGLDLKDG